MDATERVDTASAINRAATLHEPIERLNVTTDVITDIRNAQQKLPIWKLQCKSI